MQNKFRQDFDLETNIKLSSLCWRWQSFCWLTLKGIAIGRFLLGNLDMVLTLVCPLLLIIGVLTFWRNRKKRALPEDSLSEAVLPEKVMSENASSENASSENASPENALPVIETVSSEEPPAEPLVTKISLQLVPGSADTIDLCPVDRKDLPVEPQEPKEPKPTTVPQCKPTGTTLKASRTRILNYQTRQVVGMIKKDQQQAKIPRPAPFNRFPVVKKPSVRLAITKSPVKLPIIKASIRSILSKPPVNTSFGNQANTKGPAKKTPFTASKTREPVNRFRNASPGKQVYTKESVNPAMLQTPVNASVTKEPVNRFRNSSPGKQVYTKESVNPAMLQTTVNASVTKEPVNRFRNASPGKQVYTKESVNPAMLQTPVNASVTKEPVNRFRNASPGKQVYTKESVNPAMLQTPVNASVTKEPVNRFRNASLVNQARTKEPFNRFRNPSPGKQANTKEPVNPDILITSPVNASITRELVNPPANTKLMVNPVIRKPFVKSAGTKGNVNSTSKPAPVNQSGIEAYVNPTETKDTVNPGTNKPPFKPHPRRGLSQGPDGLKVPRQADARSRSTNREIRVWKV
ncbi:putative uncharacterized protein ENSP00000383309 [Drosophila kikkawai]|uniref:Uncharacterized protein n=1 Tax=Drosophila kikkawai TaxID=30033 RepID=A0A6P4IHA1_DROKI|nr:uncharacterized protein LOC108075199 [Drosophila kikkawai]